MPEQDNGLIHEFALEVAEHVEASERLLVRAATDALSSDEINLLFRSFHSVKGLARVVDCAPLERLAHATESLLSPVRDGERPLDQTLQDLLLQSLDAIRGARGALLDGAPVQPDEAFLASLAAALLDGPGASAHDAHAVGPAALKDIFSDGDTLVALAELFEELLPQIARAVAEPDSEAADLLDEDIATLRYALSQVGMPALERSALYLADQRNPAGFAHSLCLIDHFSRLIGKPCGVDQASVIARPWLAVSLLKAIDAQRMHEVDWLLRLLLPTSPFVSLVPQFAKQDCPPELRQDAFAMLAECVASELIPDAPSSADLHAMAASRIRNLLAQPFLTPEPVSSFLEGRKIDLDRFRTLPPTLIERLSGLVEDTQSDFFEIVVELPRERAAQAEFAAHVHQAVEPLIAETMLANGAPSLALLVFAKKSAEALCAAVLRGAWEAQVIAVAKLDGRQTHTHYGAVVRTAPDKIGGGAQVRVPVALLDSMFGRIGQFFAVTTRFNSLVFDTEVPEILREITEYGVLHAPHLLPMVDRLIRQQSEYAALETELHRLISVIHEMTLGLRVIPIDTLFSRFPRMVRDTAQKQGKLVRFDSRSNDIRVDNGMLELLADPLMHMLRNCVDHGVESPSDRERAGKARTASLILSAEQRGNRILLEIGDDGRGIDLDRVRARAIASDLVNAETAAGLSDDQIARFIFSPGFSTAPAVTDTSGRGVGMDVALVNVTKLGGKIDILNRPGKGVTFRIDIPLSKAIQSVLLASTGVQTVAFPDRMVIEGAISPVESIQYVNGQRSILLHDRFLPLFSVCALLQLPPPPAADDRELSIVVCELGGRRIGVEVGRILRRTDMLIQEMHPRIANLPGVGGIATVGTDKIVILVDPEGLFDLARRSAVFGLRTHEARLEERAAE